MPKYEIELGDLGVRGSLDQAVGAVFRIVPDVGAEFPVYAAVSRTLAAVWGYPDRTKLEELNATLVTLALEEIKKKLHSFTPRTEYDSTFAFQVLLTTANQPGPKPVLDKVCQFQDRAPSGFICTISSPDDPYAGKTTATLCRSCDLPDDRLRCDHLMHTTIWAQGQGPRRKIKNSLCNIGKTDMDWSRCRADGHDCWRQTYVATVPGKTAVPTVVQTAPPPSPSQALAGSEAADVELLQRLLASRETEAVEFKPASARDTEFRKTIIAFANDFNENKEGYLVIGADDAGRPVGVDGNIDAFQRKIVDIARDQCTPSIMPSIKAVTIDGKALILVHVKQSPMRPHYDGDVYVRIGTATRRADDHEVDFLRKSANSKLTAILKMQRGGEHIVTVAPSKNKDSLGEFCAECRIEKVTDQFVTIVKLASSGSFSIPLEQVHIARDEKRYRPKFHIYPPRPLEEF